MEHSSLGSAGQNSPVSALASSAAARAGELAEDDFRLLADHIPTLCWIADGEGYILWYNRGWHEYCGTTPKDMRGWRWQSVHHPDVLPSVLDRWTKSIRTGNPFEMTFPLRGADGIYRPFLTRVKPVRDASGAIRRWFGVNTDISAEKATEEQLRELMDGLPLLVSYIDRDLRYQLVNKAYEDWFGITKEALLGKTVQEVLGVEPFNLRRQRIDGVLRGVPQAFEASTPRYDGELRETEVQYLPRRGPDGQVIGFIAVVTDITDRRSAERALHQSEALQRAITEATPECIKIVRANGALMHMNAAGIQMIEADCLASVQEADTLALVAPEDREAWINNHRRVLSGERLAWEFDIVGLAGTRRHMETHAVPLKLPGGEVAQLAVTRDVTRKKETESALEAQARHLRTLNETGAAIAAELDVHHVVQLVTDAGVELTGAKFGAFFYNVIDDAGEALLLYTLAGAERSEFERFGNPRATAIFEPTFKGEGVVRSDDITKDPRYGQNSPNRGMPPGHLPVRSYLAVPVISRSGEVVGGLFFGHPEPGVFTDTSEQLILGLAGQAAIAIDNARLFEAAQRANQSLERRVQERTRELDEAHEALRQSQKMEAIGQLTGGIAHDFNNLLTVIRGSADLLKRSDLAEAKRRRYVDAISDTADRAAKLTGQLLAFARRQALKPELFDLASTIAHITDMLRTMIGSRVTLRLEKECEDCIVEADLAQFETALVNMAVNARDAMEGEGTLTISIDSIAGAGGKDAVRLRFADTGKGIAADQIDRIFEPFYTTKEVGKGTGLGLSQVYGFVKQSDGEISVQSEVGLGTTFTLTLPRAQAGIIRKEASETELSALGGGGRLLVVEDNPQVGEFACQLLADLGFDAVLEQSAAEALERLETEANSFELVFSDVVMPGMDGVSFGRVVRERWSHLPVVLTSGYSHMLAEDTRHGFPLVQKPYSAEALSKALREARQPH